ncbi:MAG: hypothetical protein JJU11_01765, partial [Candidatus Sumerlaeia bacterium]|nr:hypothetical protein [Candidatus Sumerlaeia bacterium]
MKSSLLTLPVQTALLLALVLVIGCGHRSSPPNNQITLDPRIESSRSTERQPVRVALNPETIERLNRMAFWINALVPEETDAEIVWEAHGHSLTRGEYERTLGDFLDGREQTPELVDEYHSKLETQVQLIRYLELGHLEDSDRLLERARPALRERMAELVLEPLMGDWEPSHSDLPALYEHRPQELAQPERGR